MAPDGRHHEPHGHGAPTPGHGEVHLTEADWAAYAAQTERQGEVFMPFLTDTIRWIDDVRTHDVRPVRRILDVGSGPGVAACQLALAYPQARVTAVDSSVAMLAAATQRASRLGLAERVETRLGELPDGVDGLGGADLIWASMSLHHIGDEVGALRVLRDLLRPTGLIAVAEMAEQTRVLPEDLDLGRPGFVDRLAAAGAAWFTDMRHGLPGSVASGDVPSMLAAAGFDVVGQRIAHERLDPPLTGDARRVAHGELLRTRSQLGDRLDADDREMLDLLCDEDDPRGAMHLAELFMASSRQIVIGRPAR
jgi:SAM-dependent methyltransferase